MNIKVSIVKLAIKLTPNKLIVWTANIILKDIAKLTEFNFDLEPRVLHLKIHLAGELEAIEVDLLDFKIVASDDTYHFFMAAAQSNRLWLTNILSRITQKNWKVPVVSQTEPYMKFIAELLELQEDGNADIKRINK